MPQRHGEIPLTFLAFAVLSVEGRDLTRDPYSEGRRILETLGLDGSRWRVPEAFDVGRRSERAWVKVKNRFYWRYELEREGAIRSRPRTLVDARG
jgi:ATP-dependent DNA ligase